MTDNILGNPKSAMEEDRTSDVLNKLSSLLGNFKTNVEKDREMTQNIKIEKQVDNKKENKIENKIEKPTIINSLNKNNIENIKKVEPTQNKKETQGREI